MGKKKSMIYTILLFNVIAAHLVFVAGLTVFSSELNWAIFSKKYIESHTEKIWLVQTLGLWLAIYLFALATLVMTMRVFTGKTTPASNNDPVYINTLNRILTNTIEQAIIFGGLFAPLLFSQKNNVASIGGTRVLALASLFVVGRVSYSIGYALGPITGISTLRSLGFALNLLVNASMVSYHLGFNAYGIIEQHFTPLLKGLV